MTQEQSTEVRVSNLVEYMSNFKAFLEELDAPEYDPFDCWDNSLDTEA